MFSRKTINAAKLWIARWKEERKVVFDDLYMDIVLLELNELLLTDEDIQSVSLF